MKPLFTESQRFNQWWIWLIVIFACGLPFIIFIQQIIFEKTIGDNPMSDSAVIFSLIIPVIFLLLFYAMQLKTEITRDTLSFRFVPFVKRTIPWKDMETFKVINYGFVGGYGVRLTMKYGTVYNVRGKEGLFVKLKNGKTFIIGTQKPKELEKAIQQLKS